MALETDLNAQVYALFDLTPAEIKIIEESTKYPTAQCNIFPFCALN